MTSSSPLFRAYVRITAVVLFYWVISISMVFVNKHILSDPSINLNAPISITFFQCVCAIIFTVLIGRANVTYQPSILQLIQFPRLRYQWKYVKQTLPLTVTFVGMIVFNNLCLQHVQIAFYFVGRSLSTVFNVLFTYFLLQQKTSLPALLCCLIIVVGFAMGCDQEQLTGELTWRGILYGLLASIFVSLNSIYAKRVLPKLDDNVWLVNFYNNIIGFFMFVPLIYCSGEIKTVLNYNQFSSPSFWFILCLSGIFAYLIAFASVLQIKLTSPLTHNISGTVKACIQTLMAVIIFSQHKPFLWWISNGLVIFGSMMYTRVRQLEMKQKMEQQQFVDKKEGKVVADSDLDDRKVLLNVKSV